MVKFTLIPEAKVESIRTELNSTIDRMRGVVATDIIWTLELQVARLNPEVFPSVEREF